jgi:ketosteroid isomerase-like protein
MQHHIIRLFVSLVTFIIGVSATAMWPADRPLTPPHSEARQEILKIEREYLDAHLARDTATLDRILADDFIFWHSGTRHTNKAQRLALMEAPDFTFLSIDTNSVDVDVDGDKAFVSGRAVVRGRYKQREFVSPPYGYLRVYEKREGRWQIISVQATPFDWD